MTRKLHETGYILSLSLSQGQGSDPEIYGHVKKGGKENKRELGDGRRHSYSDPIRGLRTL